MQTPRQMFIVWLMASASATTPQRRRTPAAAFFVPPRRLADRVVPSAIVAVAVGFVLGFWGDKVLPGFFCNTLPPPVAGAWSPPSCTVRPSPSGPRRRQPYRLLSPRPRSKGVRLDRTGRQPRRQGLGLA